MAIEPKPTPVGLADTVKAETTVQDPVLDVPQTERVTLEEEAQKEIPDMTAEQLKDWKSPNKPRITNYLGECFLKIATHLSYKPNFVNYMFREDMISDGIENCVQYMLNFDPKKSNNPFAYFTQIIHYAFLRRIQKEKKQLEIKTKIIEKTGYDQVMVVEDGANGTSSDYNSIKEKIHYKLNRQ